MPYYPAPAERPRQPKRFLTSREVEDMVAVGQTTIVHIDDLVITDAARETAQDLGLRITKTPELPVGPPRAAPAEASTGAAALAPAARPPQASSVPTPGSTDSLVQALVHAVRARKG